MDASPVSRRAAAIHQLSSFTVIRDFYFNSTYTERRTDPGIIDFTFGNPHDMPMPEYADALRDVIAPQAKDWYQRLKSRPSFRPLLAERVRGVTPVSHYADLDF